MRARQRLWVYVQLAVAALMFTAVIVVEIVAAFP